MIRIILMAAVLVWPWHAAAAEPELSATVIQVKPKALLTRGEAQPEALGVGRQALRGDRLWTSPVGAATLVMADGSEFAVKGGSELVMGRDTDGQPLFELVKGLFQAAVLKGGANRWKVHTSSATAGIKGTEYQVQVKEGSTEVKVLSGEVALSSPQGLSVSVQAGESAESWPDRVSAVRKMNAEEVRRLRAEFVVRVRSARRSMADRVRKARGEKTSTPEGGK